ncbi:hypothetical protein IMG5_095250 [Ichthyophthirius multifiliis]|uniref:Uncharacterized protein n=1 Tax=Ichthyophthirius multifiliis TaxID=5932 RepID=G0QRN0_ICHMU|nr:hypothetical protein IMG5_095250 [Ichthyophthirius multifiliis]EGR32129.1 hypothetical protein IMG5_095250 [Ichthyophthirius multifiliis]|eukprot:XP_004035615.1 hypothetical protein IMG5_095250 [Ichthyophthirius multifiliis]
MDLQQPKPNINLIVLFKTLMSNINQVFGLGNGYFSVNNVWYPGSLLIFPNQVFLWDVQTAADIKAHTLDFIEFVKPRPDYIIIGTGKEKFFLEESIYDRFAKQNIRVDVLPTF